MISAALMPSMTGILTSMRTRSGRSSRVSVNSLLAIAGLSDDLVARLAEHLDTGPCG
jgi:hypothetical protein